LRPVRIAAKMPLRELGIRAGIKFPRVTQIEADPPEGAPISIEERAAYLNAVESWATDRAEKYVKPASAIVQEPARVEDTQSNASEIAVMVSALLEFGKKHCFPSLEIGPGVRLVAGEDGWKKFVASNTGYQISKAHTAALAIDPAWFKLGGKS
jgi:uncharacterized protein YfaA (DUF2138 family)